MKKLTYTKAELQKEAKVFALYYGREELMSEPTKKRYEAFCEKVKVYDREKGNDQTGNAEED